MSKLPENQAEKIHSNFEGKKFRSIIKDQIAVKKLIRKHLYKKQIQTPVQEYLSNALDAMALSKKLDQPIKVYLPDLSDGMFKIRDFGPGLSDDEVENIYANIGESTKREDNNSIGCWGYGSKSYYAYTNEFFVISYYNGIATTFLAKIEEDDDTSFEIIDKQETSEPNGLEVQCPVKDEDVNKFCESVVRCCFFWKVKPIVIGDVWKEKVEALLSESDNLLFNVSHGRVFRLSDHVNKILGTRNGVIVNAGGIPFNMLDAIIFHESINKLPKNHDSNTLVIDLKIGELDIPPDRETLNESKQNIGILLSRYLESLISYEERYFYKIENYSDLDELQLACTEYKTSVVGSERQFRNKKIEYQGLTYLINSDSNVMWDCSDLGLNLWVVKDNENKKSKRVDYELKPVKSRHYNHNIPAIVYFRNFDSEKKTKNMVNKFFANMGAEDDLFKVEDPGQIKYSMFSSKDNILSLQKLNGHITIENIVDYHSVKWPKSVKAKAKVLAKICKVSDEKNNFWFDEHITELEFLQNKIVEVYSGRSYRSHYKSMHGHEKQAIMEMKKIHKEKTGAVLDIFFISSGVKKKLDKLSITTKSIKEQFRNYITEEDVASYTQQRKKVSIPNSLKKILLLPFIDELNSEEVPKIKILCEKQEIYNQMKEKYESKKLPFNILRCLNFDMAEEINEKEEGIHLEKELKEKYPLFLLIAEHYLFESIVSNEKAFEQFKNCWKQAAKGKM